MKHLKQLPGLDARRISFILQNGDNHYLLLSVIEILQPDMQDFNEYSDQNHPFSRRAKKARPLKDNIYMTIDCLRLDKEFLEHPERNFSVNGTKLKFYNKEFSIFPKGEVLPYILSDSLENDRGDVSAILPKRSCSKSLYAYIDTERTASGNILRHPRLLEQLSQLSTDYYGTDLSRYPEYLGNIYLVQYNPVFRHLDFTVSENPNGLYMIFKFRPDASGNVIARIANKNNVGFYISEDEFTFPVSKSIHFAAMESVPDVIDVKIFDDGGNMLYYHNDMHFLRGVNLNMSVASKEVRLITETDKGTTENTVVKYSSVSDGITVDSQIPNVIDTRSLANAYKILERDLSFILFDGDKNRKKENVERAKKAIRKILEKAHRRCMICDPYFSLKDLTEFVFTISSLDVDIRIISSARFLGRNATEAKDKALRIQRTIDNFISKVGGKIQFRLLKGSPMLHDRFIIADDNVWMLGSSLNEFGSRATTIVRVPDASSKSMYDMAEKWWSDNRCTISLDDYVGN